MGKTFLLTKFSTGEVPTGYIPTVFDQSTHPYTLDGRTIDMDLWDTAGQEELARLRVLSYNKADAVLLCFSVIRPLTLENIKLKWLPRGPGPLQGRTVCCGPQDRPENRRGYPRGRAPKPH